MSAQPGIWTGPQVVERLKELFERGVSCSDIAFELTKEFSRRFTRNAVIGKAHRHGFVSPHSGKRGYNGMRRSARAAKQFGYQPRTKAPAAAPALAAAPLPPEPVTLAEPRHVSLMDLKHGDCRYPFGDGPQYTFCGCRAMPDRPYCEPHQQVCSADMAAYQRRSAAQQARRDREREAA